MERYDHQSVTSHAYCIGRSSVSDLDSCGQKWIPFRTRLSERRSECATSGNWIAVRRSFGRRSSVGRPVAPSVGRTVSIPFNCFRRKCTTATPRILPNYRTSRPAKRSTTKSRQTNQHAVRIPIPVHVQLSRDKWMGKTTASLANETEEANVELFGQANLAATILLLS